MKKRIFSMILVFVLVLSVFAACSDNEDKDTQGDASDNVNSITADKENKGLSVNNFINNVNEEIIMKPVYKEEDYRGDFYVSPSGDDSWSGTLASPSGNDGPFKTFSRAKKAVNEKIKDGMERDLKVLFREGIYENYMSLTFDQTDSGRDGYNVIYAAYPGENAIIDGGRTISDWKPYKDGIYMAEVHMAWEFTSMYENNTRAAKARFPDSGYLNTYGKSSEKIKSEFFYKEGEIPEITQKENLEAYLWAGGPDGEWNWYSAVIPVRDIDMANKKITLSSDAGYEIGKGSRYFLQNSLALLDKSGEFYHDIKNGMVYYKPVSLPIEDQRIYAPLINGIVNIKGSNGANTVQNIVFDNLKFRNSGSLNGERGIINLENTENITITNCELYFGECHGVFAVGLNRNIIISGNHIFEVGNTGIQINAYSPEPVSTGHLITNNFIHDTGKTFGHGAGIQLMEAGDSVISYNRVMNTPRYSISIKGTHPDGLIGQTRLGTLITKKNAKEYTFSRNNIIEYNDVSHANCDSQDTGPIEMWCPGYGNIVRNNAVHDSEIHFSYGFGIYLDDASDNTTVENNIIYDMQKYGKGKFEAAIYCKGIENLIKNNIAVNNKGNAFLTTFEMANVENYNITVENNITSNNGDVVYNFTDWRDDRFKATDKNIYYNSKNTYKINGCPKASDFTDWKKILGNKFDQNSITEDPKIIDPENLDFRFMPDSPAYKLGFNDIEYSKIGMLESFLYTPANETPTKLFVWAKGENTGKAYKIIKEGESFKMAALVRTQNGFAVNGEAKLEFTIENSGIAQVDADGKITGLKKGEAKVDIACEIYGKNLESVFYVIVQ